MNTAAGSPFVVDIPIRFAHCDPAGIVFYPRYFEMFNSVVEDWCADGLGFGFREMHLERGLGLPTVHIETDFAGPSELGEVLRAELTVQKLGEASLTISIRLLSPGGDLRVKSRQVLVMMDLRRRCAIPIPDTLRERIGAFRADDNE